eukprot:s148_g9.t1
MPNNPDTYVRSLTENGEDLVGRDVVAQLLLTPNAQPVNLVEVAKVQKVLEERRRHLPLQTRRSRAVVRMLRQVLAGQAKLSSCAEFEAVGCKDTKPECK